VHPTSLGSLQDKKVIVYMTSGNMGENKVGFPAASPEILGETNVFILPNQITFFNQIYLGHANRVISSLVGCGKADKISRSRIEMQILEEIDKSDFPTPYRIAWISLVCVSVSF
jgi:hypothetical protein